MGKIYLSKHLYDKIDSSDWKRSFKQSNKGTFMSMDYKGKRDKYIIDNYDDDDYKLCSGSIIQKCIIFVGFDFYKSLDKNAACFNEDRTNVVVIDEDCKIEQIISYEILAEAEEKDIYIKSISEETNDDFKELLSAWHYILEEEMVTKEEMFDIIEKNEWDFESIVSNIMAKFGLEEIASNADNSSTIDNIEKLCNTYLEKIEPEDIYKNLYKLVFSGKVFGGVNEEKFCLKSDYVDPLTKCLKNTKEKATKKIMDRKNGWVKECVFNKITEKMIELADKKINLLYDAYSCLCRKLKKNIKYEPFYKIPISKDDDFYSTAMDFIDVIDYAACRNKAQSGKNDESEYMFAKSNKLLAENVFESFKNAYINYKWGGIGKTVLVYLQLDKFINVIVEKEPLEK